MLFFDPQFYGALARPAEIARGYVMAPTPKATYRPIYPGIPSGIEEVSAQIEAERAIERAARAVRRHNGDENL